MGKKERKATASSLGSQANQKNGGIGGQRNVLAAKNDFVIVDQLKNGRYECSCEARIHELIRNCLGCGRIVCAQEGSGPCFSCGELVCTREEREILNRGSKKSNEFLAKLTGQKVVPRSELESDQSYQDARNFSNKLLEADADTERRTKVQDLESDYTNEESSAFLTATERAELIARREELRQFREKDRKKFKVNVDVGSGTVQQLNRKTHTDGNLGADPVIQAILQRADERLRAQEVASRNAANARWDPIGFVPRYLKDENRPKLASCSDVIDAEMSMYVSDEIKSQIVEQKGWTIALEQPTASFLANGLIKYVRWKSHTPLKGPLFIAAKTKSTNEAEIRDYIKKYIRDSSKVEDVDFADGAILGKAFLDECMLLDDFYEVYGKKLEIPGEGDFVLCFTIFDPLTTSLPYIPKEDLFELEQHLKKSLTLH